MELFAVRAACWVVGKALGPIKDGVLDAWAASKGLGPNVDALKMELLYAQAMLDNTPQGMDEIRSPALAEMLLKLQQLAYDADDALDEMDYFRIQDDLEGTYHAAGKDPRGLIQDAALHTHHTVTDRVIAAIEQLCPSSEHSHPDPDKQEQEQEQAVVCCGWRLTRQRERGSTSSLPHNNQSQPEVGGVRKLASSACHTFRALGKQFPCCSFTPVQAEPSSAPNKLEFHRVMMSQRLEKIASELKPLCAKVSDILNLQLLNSHRSIAKDIVANISVAVLREEGRASIPTKTDVKSRIITTSYISDPIFCGREVETNKIKSIITSEGCLSKDLTVLPISGLGGIGKTTLARHIYDEVEKDFDARIWVCVSVNFSVARALQEIVKAIPRVDNEESNAPKEKLIEQRLQSKRFLLVLDDMWDPVNNDEWERLLAPLRKGQKKGNIVLVTSRSPALAQMVRTTNDTVELEGLDEQAFWELFQSYVFDDEESKTQALLDIGKEIVKKLKGSPLAAKTVGRLLRNHLDQNHWTRVLESKEWELQTGDSDIMPALKLSFDFLPVHLQRCFSYCALFPEDCKFHSKWLIYWWIGLDILQPSHQNKSIEDIGLSNLNDLVNHGFIKGELINGHTYYIIHDLLRDLGLKVAARECLSIDHSNVGSIEIWPTVRHLSIIITDANDDEQFAKNFVTELRMLNTRLKIENLQTLMVFGDIINESFSSFFGDLMRKATGLRVVFLSKMTFRLEFSTLTHLRYLSLGRFYGREIHLPSMLSRFYHLRILDLQEWNGSLDLPRDMSNLTKLGHFLTSDDKAYSKICNVGKLKFLQELKQFEVNKECKGFEPKQLGNMMELRDLGIYHLEKIHTKEAAAEAKLIDKRHLVKLTLHWGRVYPENECDVKGEILEGLQPHRNLKELCISGHGSHSCPTWLGSKLSIKDLQSLHLVGVDWEVLPSVGHMMLLRELTLENMSTVQEFGPRHFGSINEQSFGSLKRLTLMGVRLKKWVLGSHFHLFSHLEVFIIEHCHYLSGLPFTDNTIYYPPRQDQEGKIHWFPNLQELKINNCKNFVLLPPIPWTQTLRSVEIDRVGSSTLTSLEYFKSSKRKSLDINGMDLKALAVNNLTDLETMLIRSCPSLQFKDLQMLTSLKSLSIEESEFVPLGREGEVKWHIPVECLCVNRCRVTGKGLTQLLSHLPKLSELRILGCDYVKMMAVEQQQPRAHLPSTSASTVRAEDAQATCLQQQEIGDEEAEDIENGDDGLLLLPAHLSASLRRLEILSCRQLSLVAYPPLPNGYKTGGEGGGLHALGSLQELRIAYCPELFSAYKKSPLPSCFPFPSSLKVLVLSFIKGIVTLELISNLTALTHLTLLLGCGDNLRAEDLWSRVTRGHLSEFFVSSDLTRGLQDEDQELPLGPPCKLRELETDDITGFLTEPICNILCSSLTKLTLREHGEVEEVRFTKEHEDALQLLTSLEDLIFVSFEKMRGLPTCLHTLPKLKRLEICWCKLICSLPKDGLPVSLQELDVRSCRNEELKQQCRNFILDHPGIKLIDHF